MKSLYLDNVTKDLEVSNNNLRFTNSATEYTAQKIEDEMKFFKGEWYLNIDLGIPYYEDILKKNPDVNLINTIFKNKLLSISGVTEIISFNVDFDKSLRIYNISWSIKINEEIVNGGLNI